MNGGGSLLGNAALFEVSPFLVDEGERIGFLHEDKAAALGRLMAVDGQRDPIKVAAQPDHAEQPWRLVTGMHRLVGARIEGITVFAIEVSGSADALADLEASENLHRRPLAPIERAKFVHALCDAAQLRLAREQGDANWQRAGARKRWAQVKAGEILAEQALQDEGDDSADKMSAVYGWQESAADAFGLDKRSIRRALRLYRLVIEPFPELVHALSEHPVVGETESQLKLIAEIVDEGQRRRLIETLLDDPELSVEMAKAQLGLGVGGPGAATPLAHQKHVNAVVGNLARLSATHQKRHLGEFVSALRSDEVKRALRDLLDRELGDAE